MSEVVTPAPSGARGLLWRILVVLTPFALGYYMSVLVRSINAVIGPVLSEEIGLTAANLGLLTAAYFIAFAAFQLPLGILLDRYGPRLTQACVLLIAAVGAFAFAFGQDAIWLTVARGLIGMGVSGGLMSALKAMVRWFPQERMPLVNSAFLVIGGIGILTASEPIEHVLVLLGWRNMFMCFAAVIALSSILIFFVVPPDPPSTASTSWRVQIAELGQVYRSAYFWRLTPAVAMHFAAVFGVMGLWTPYWLSDVDGLSRPEVLSIMLYMAISFTIGTISVGIAGDWLSRRGVPLGRAMGWGFIAFLVVEATLVLRAPLPAGWIWLAIGAFGNLTVLSFALTAQNFPASLVGRALTGINLVSLGGAFAVQWLLGVIIGLWPKAATGAYPATAYVVAFSVLVAANAASVANYYWPRRGSPAD